MSRQLTFRLPVREALGRDDFFVSPANAWAVAMIEDWRGWPAGKLALTGPRGAGKTHLVHVWAAESGGRIVSAAELSEDLVPALAEGDLAVEDVPAIAGDKVRERALFHLHNLVLANGHTLLLTGAEAPGRWPLALADLTSRMQGTPAVRIEPPDDALLAAILFKRLADRQLTVEAELIHYLVPRIDRDFDTARRVVERLDARALSEKREVRVPLAREVLAEITPEET
ncbi:DnaA/Hda family protein [Tranquillimonas alkanivorans]|uniref:DnaA protein n=1 Tax=Tranquillimonas alkanivorans TaxID=441119 RepID=A0A1I5N5Z1_9RHOB|nr:DnaA/Hda family protein [Tranquillimonas alkanivorans]SFP17335.1 dnaA protein [Tranquillimonas alkanivorans]